MDPSSDFVHIRTRANRHYKLSRSSLNSTLPSTLTIPPTEALTQQLPKCLFKMTIYDAYVPIMSKALTSLHAILTKAEAHAKENGTDADTEYIGASIYSDMKPLPFQIQTVANMVKVTSIPLTGVTPEWPSEDKSFAELFARVEMAREVLQTIKPELVNGKDDEEFEL